MLTELLIANRELLIERCRGKAAERYAPTVLPEGTDHGVPLFLGQLIEALNGGPSKAQIGRASALHGAEMLRAGFSVGQVVHGYGDVCQSVTELAIERKSAISTDEFRILNRCLDDAIADAVTAFGVARQTTVNERAEALHDRLGTFLEEQRRLVAIALQAHAAISTGNIGMNGATGALLVHTLEGLRALADRMHSVVGLANATATLSPG